MKAIYLCCLVYLSILVVDCNGNEDPIYLLKYEDKNALHASSAFLLSLKTPSFLTENLSYGEFVVDNAKSKVSRLANDALEITTDETTEKYYFSNVIARKLARELNLLPINEQDRIYAEAISDKIVDLLTEYGIIPLEANDSEKEEARRNFYPDKIIPVWNGIGKLAYNEHTFLFGDKIGLADVMAYTLYAMMVEYYHDDALIIIEENQVLKEKLGKVAVHYPIRITRDRLMKEVEVKMANRKRKTHDEL